MSQTSNQDTKLCALQKHSNMDDENRKKIEPCIKPKQNERDEMYDEHVSLYKYAKSITEHPVSDIIYLVVDKKQQNEQNDKMLSTQSSISSEQKRLEYDKTFIRRSLDSDYHSFKSHCGERNIKTRRINLFLIALMYFVCVGISVVLCYMMINRMTKVEKWSHDHTIALYHPNITKIDKYLLKLEHTGKDTVPFTDTPSSFLTYDVNKDTFKVLSSGTYQILLTLALIRDNPSQSSNALICIRYNNPKNREFCKRAHMIVNTNFSFDLLDIVQLKENDEFRITVNSIHMIYKNRHLNRMVIKYNR